MEAHQTAWRFVSFHPAMRDLAAGFLLLSHVWGFDGLQGF
jgi:hypothetical protein